MGLAILFIKLINVFKEAPILGNQFHDLKDASLTIIIPTYNEESNIEKCLQSIFSSKRPCENWKIIMVDDCSTDDTVKLARKKAKQMKINTDNFMIINAGERPSNEHWVGKNWPCYRALESLDSTWVLFIDADICLEETTLRRALSKSISEEIDLLTIAPRLKCSCLAEWMVQPIIASLLGFGFPFKAINDPNSKIAFAAGPFMLFRTSAYKSIGGHKSLAGEVVEDIAFAYKIKNSGYKLYYLLGLDAIELRMYQDFSSLWEGWSKNWFIGLDRSIVKSLGASLSVFTMFSIPWLIVPINCVILVFSSGNTWLLMTSILFGFSGIYLQFLLRRWVNRTMNFPVKYWWLMGVGGIILGLIGPNSIWKTTTGKGWTWKGRPLGY